MVTGCGAVCAGYIAFQGARKSALTQYKSAQKTAKKNMESIELQSKLQESKDENKRLKHYQRDLSLALDDVYFIEQMLDGTTNKDLPQLPHEDIEKYSKIIFEAFVDFENRCCPYFDYFDQFDSKIVVSILNIRRRIRLFLVEPGCEKAEDILVHAAKLFDGLNELNAIINNRAVGSRDYVNNIRTQVH